MGSDPVRARCTACGRHVVLNAKGRFPRHQMKGGAFCLNVGTTSPKAAKTTKTTPAQRTTVAGKGQSLRGSKRRVRVIRLGRGPMGSESPGASANRRDAGKGFWRPRGDWFDQRPGEE